MTDTFMGIPISGDVEKGLRGRTDQLTQEEFAALVKPLLDDPNIVELSWRQYTPYFNDGDVCEFTVYDLSLRTVWDSEDADRDELCANKYHKSIGNLVYKYDDEPTEDRWGRVYRQGRYVDAENPHFDADRLAKAEALSAAMANGSTDNLLYDLFGDHATVTVTRDGIAIDYYEHD